MLVAGDAELSVDGNTQHRSSYVQLKYERPSPHQHPSEALHQFDDHTVRIADRLEVYSGADDGVHSGLRRRKEHSSLPNDQDSGITGAVGFPVDPTATAPIAEVFEINERANKFCRVTHEIGAKLVGKASRGVRLVFNIVKKTKASVYQLVWFSSPQAVKSVMEKVAQFLTDDEQPLHIRLHYQCNALGHPCWLLTVIATGQPPQPKEEEKLEDGMYTACCKEGSCNLSNNFISSRNRLTVLIDISSTSIASGKPELRYSFKKGRGKGRNKCIRMFERIATPNAVPCEVRLRQKVDGYVASGGDSVFVIEYQVSVFAEALSDLVVSGGFPTLLGQNMPKMRVSAHFTQLKWETTTHHLKIFWSC